MPEPLTQLTSGRQDLGAERFGDFVSRSGAPAYAATYRTATTMQPASRTEGATLMAATKKPTGTTQVEAIVHGEKRSNIPTAGAQDLRPR